MFSTLGITHRWDPPFLLRLTELIRARGIDSKDEKKVIALYKELNDRNEFPKGHTVVKAPKHIECPKCFSWDVDGEETTTVKTVDGIKHSTFAANYNCRGCKQAWRVESGANEQVH